MKIPLILLFSTVLLLGNAQVDTTKSEIFGDHPEISAEFPGGVEKLYEYINKNLKFPSILSESYIEGKIYVQFDIDEFGMIQNVKVVKGVHKSLDEEALRIVCIMPDWIPAEVNGTCIKSKFTLPIRIKMH